MMHMHGVPAVEPNDLLTLAGVFVGGIIMGIVGYLRSKPAARTDHIKSIGVEFGNREQSERQIEVLVRISALEVLADKRTTDIEEIHRSLLDRLDAQERREEQEESLPRPIRPHRRPP